MGTSVDFDEAVANPEATRARLAAGEKLTLVRDGVPFADLSKPEDLDELDPRRPNPPVARASFTPHPAQVAAIDEFLKRAREHAATSPKVGAARMTRDDYYAEDDD